MRTPSRSIKSTKENNVVKEESKLWKRTEKLVTKSRLRNGFRLKLHVNAMPKEILTVSEIARKTSNVLLKQT